MATFLKHQQEFGGANRVLVAVMSRNGDMFTPQFFEVLKDVTDEVFFLPGVDRGRVQSLFTPNVRYTEVVEDGIAAGNVIPDDFEPTPRGSTAVRRNILKAGIVGRLVANDFSGAIVSAELMEFDPTTGKRLDFIAVAEEIEARVRQKFDAAALAASHVAIVVESSPVDIHVIGFSKVVGDIADGRAARGRVLPGHVPDHRRARLPVRAVAAGSRRWCSPAPWWPSSGSSASSRCSASAWTRCRSWCRSWCSPSP